MPEVFSPGDKVEWTGVYKVIHAYEHVPSHHVTVLYGDRFPPCVTCIEKVRFELAVSALHVNAHALFKHSVG
jgi:hypothetical protein